MAITRIETTADFLTASEGEGFFTARQMTANVVRYWGKPEDEKQFLLPFWKSDELILGSQTRQIAFKVTNIEDPAQVDATWISFNPNPEAEPGSPSVWRLIRRLRRWLKTLMDSVVPPPDEACFVFGEELVPVEGNRSLKRNFPHHRHAVVARIGRNEAGVTVVHFLAAEIRIKANPGTGGGGDASGALIPSGR